MVKKLEVVKSSSGECVRFVFWFGACAPTYILAYGRSLEDALDEAIDWLAENAPGHIIDSHVAEEYNRLIAEGKNHDDAAEESCVDTYCGGDSGHYIDSSEWGIVFENPYRAQLKAWIAD